MMQLSLWGEKTPRPPLGSTFQQSESGSNPCIFLGKIGCNYEQGMNIHEDLYYWHCIKAEATTGSIRMTCKVIGYAGSASCDLETDEESEGCGA